MKLNHFNQLVSEKRAELVKTAMEGDNAEFIKILSQVCVLDPIFAVTFSKDSVGNIVGDKAINAIILPMIITDSNGVYNNIMITPEFKHEILEYAKAQYPNYKIDTNKLLTGVNDENSSIIEGERTNN